MKKISSAVWKFFERIHENNRCIAVVCKLCENQYKFFGNTTNLRVHLSNKHPIQWEMSEIGNMNESSIPNIPNNSEVKDSRTTKRKKYAARLSVSNLEPIKNASDSDPEDESATLNMVRQMHGDDNSAEEWLDEDPYQITHIETFEPKPKRNRRVKYRKIKREVQSPIDLPGFYTVPKPDTVVYEETQQRKDEYSVFGEYVANKLRKIKTPRTCGNLQQLITTLLWQAEYGMYDSAEAVKRVLMISVTPEVPETAINTTDFEHGPTMETVIDTTEINQSNEDTTDHLV